MRCLTLCAIALAGLASEGSCLRKTSRRAHVVSPPRSKDTSLPTKMLVLIPGAAVPNERYLKVAESIQESATSLNLWVVIPEVHNGQCDSVFSCNSAGNCWQLNNRVQNALSNAEAGGWIRGDSKDIFVGGHGVGGVCANTLYQAYSKDGSQPFAGLVLLGSYVDDRGSEYSLANYSVPVLTLNAELDGTKARAGKTAHFWRQHLELAGSDGAEVASTLKPVVLLPDLSASSFCPGHRVRDDLEQEATESQALARIGAVAAAFLQLQAAAPAVQPAALGVLQEAIAWTETFLAPWLAAEALEWTPGVVAAEGANGHSPFCAAAQKVIAGTARTDSERIKIVDGFHEATGTFVKCHAESAEPGKSVEVETCSHTDYYESTDESAASSQISCKMWGAVKMGRVLRTKTDENVQCIAGNELSVRLTEALAHPRTLQRFKQRGRGFCFEEDEKTLIGPQWALLSSVRIRSDSNCMSVRSPKQLTDIDGLIYPGVHYCKFLSPTRVLDWMMTESLKP